MFDKLPSDLYNIKETEGRKRSFQRYIYLRINIRKPRSISNGIRNSDISLLPARYYPRSIVSGRKKVRFSGKRFQLNLPRCLKEKKKGREGGKKKKLPAQISREKAFLRARSGRQREAPSHHDRVKIRREKEKREREREGERERKALVGGQRSLEFHTWINSPSSGECTPPPRPTSSRFPTPSPRARGLGATTNSEIHPVQPLMNVRAACDITFPPLSPSIRYTYKGSA